MSSADATTAAAAIASTASPPLSSALLARLHVARIAPLARADLNALVHRVIALDAWGTGAGGFSVDDALRFFDPDAGLGGDGVLVAVDGVDAAFGTLYRVDRESGAAVPAVYKRYGERANWPAWADALSALLRRRVELHNIWHFYDRGVAPSQRQLGLGRFVSRVARELVQASTDDISIGTVRADDAAAVMSALKGGCLLGPHLRHDIYVDNYDVFVSLYARSLPLVWGDVLRVPPVTQGDSLRDAISAVVGPGSLASAELLLGRRVFVAWCCEQSALRVVQIQPLPEDRE